MAALKLAWTKLAISDLDDTYEYVAASNSGAAMAFHCTNTMLKLFRLTIVLPTALILLTAKVTSSQTVSGSLILANQSGESTGSTTSAEQSKEGPEVTTTTADQSEEKPETTTITMELDKPVAKGSNPIVLLYQSCKSKGYGEDVCQALCDTDVAVDYSP